MSLQRLPDRSIDKESKAKPFTFRRYSAVVLRRAGKEAWEQFGLNWKTAGAMLAYGASLWWWFHKTSTEVIVSSALFKWSNLLEAIPPTLITIGVFAILFILKGAYLLFKERAEDRDKLADLLLTETEKTNPEHKATFVLDIYPGRSTVSTVNVDSLDDEPEPGAYVLDARLQVSFMNRDISPVLISEMSLSIVTASTDEPISLPLVMPVTWQSNSFENAYFRGLTVPASHPPSEDYWIKFTVSIPIDLARSLDSKHFLRVSMEAARQNTYFVDLVINWKAVKRGDFPIICLR